MGQSPEPHTHAPEDPGYDHDHTLHAAEPVPLPGDPSLRQLGMQAKDLRRGVHRGVPADLALFTAHHPRGTQLAASDEGRRKVTLRDAQLAIARRYGFEGWQALAQSVGRVRVEERDMHRWFGVEFNNEVWDMIHSGVTPESPQSDRDLVLYGAYASARHWHECGTVANAARAEHLIARAALAVGLPDVALRHARSCVALVEGHASEMADWDGVFAREALARALAATGRVEAAREQRETALRLAGEVVDPEDRTICEAELSRPPWFGID